MKIDMHCHSYYSNDSIASPEALLRHALAKGIDGIALTDHNTTSGWKDAKLAADRLGAVLIFGEEIKIKKNGRTVGEILAYFIEKEINPKNKTIEDVIKEIKDQNGIAIIAHPYHWRKPFRDLEKYKNLADGMEGFNSRSQSTNGNKKSREYGERNNLPMVAGSDCHSFFEVGSAYIEADVHLMDELKNLIANGSVKIAGKQSPIFVQIFATLGKLLHLFWKPS